MMFLNNSQQPPTTLPTQAPGLTAQEVQALIEVTKMDMLEMQHQFDQQEHAPTEEEQNIKPKDVKDKKSRGEKEVSRRRKRKYRSSSGSTSHSRLRPLGMSRSHRRSRRSYKKHSRRYSSTSFASSSDENRSTSKSKKVNIWGFPQVLRPSVFKVQVAK